MSEIAKEDRLQERVGDRNRCFRVARWICIAS